MTILRNEVSDFTEKMYNDMSKKFGSHENVLSPHRTDSLTVLPTPLIGSNIIIRNVRVNMLYDLGEH